MTDTIRESIQVILVDRLFLYSLLHKVFGREPDRELLAVLTSDETAQAFALLSSEDGDIMARAGGFLAQIREKLVEEDYPDRLRAEYIRLFVGPAKLPAPPWESIYVGKESMLFQESTMEVRRFYKSYGMKTAGQHNIADDSLALELDFMAHLAQRAQKAFEEGNREETMKNLEGSAVFLKEHLLVWVPRFLKKMAKAPSDLLYPRMCLILDDFLKKDSSAVAELLETL